VLVCTIESSLTINVILLQIDFPTRSSLDLACLFNNQISCLSVILEIAGSEDEEEDFLGDVSCMVVYICTSLHVIHVLNNCYLISSVNIKSAVNAYP